VQVTGVFVAIWRPLARLSLDAVSRTPLDGAKTARYCSAPGPSARRRRGPLRADHGATFFAARQEAPQSGGCA
jgi:hypothetical protein